VRVCGFFLLLLMYIFYDMIYLLTAIGLSPGGSSTVQYSTVHIYTQTVHRTTQNKQYIEQHNNFRRVWAVPHLCELYPGICLTTEENGNLRQGSRTIRYKEINHIFPEDSMLTDVRVCHSYVRI